MLRLFLSIKDKAFTGTLSTCFVISREAAEVITGLCLVPKTTNLLLHLLCKRHFSEVTCVQIAPRYAVAGSYLCE